MSVKDIHITDYSYSLPDERIAKYPVAKRDESKLLVYRDGGITTKVFKQMPEVLESGTLLVCNNTKVIQARLIFEKETGGKIEIFCLDPMEPSDYQLAFSTTEGCVWHCMVGNLKRWKEGALKKKCVVAGKPVELKAVKHGGAGLNHTIEFSWNVKDVSFAEILDSIGELPIPPYLNRCTEERDKETYQTVYSKIKGSVAAPTAGLHFTENVLTQLAEMGIERAEVTLHVGAGTFYPVKSDSIGGHDMHTEVIEVKLDTLKAIRGSIGKIVAVGTTSVRTLESLYYIGCHLAKGKDDFFVSQWEPYNDVDCRITAKEAVDYIITYLESRGLDRLHASTQIIIAPGYEFHFEKAIITNFHQPKSTLLLLISAFVGDDWRKIYDYALKNGYRFLSYGDSSILFRTDV